MFTGMWRSAGRRLCVGLPRCWPLTAGHSSLGSPGCPSHPALLFSVSAPVRCAAHGEEGRWTLAVNPFSTVRARLGCSISIRPLDPHTHPDADRVSIAVRGTDGVQDAGLDQLDVRYDASSKEVLISAEGLKSSVCIDLTAPIKSNLLITSQGNGNVHVEKMECDVCKVQLEKGDCVLHSIRSHQVEVQSHGGRVTGFGTIHGNVNISAWGGCGVDVKKLQGTKMSISTEHGPLKVKAIYAESSCISSCSGRVDLGHVHGNATVKNVSGDTVIDGSNSLLKVSSHSGDINVYMGDGASAELHSQEGAVCVRVPTSLKAGVELCGTSVDISPEVVLHEVENNTTEGQTTVTGHIHGKPPVEQWLKAQADRNSVTLKTQSWFESLKLKS